MTSQVKTTFPQQIELRGYERVVTMADNLSLKIVHSMLVAGDAEMLVRFLPVALARTFNMHPRMRAMQTKGESFMAEIHEPVPLDDIANRNLLRIRRFSPSEAFENWEQYAEDECNVAIDRYTQFPFFLTVWIYEQKEQTRLMLFSDHYMSDGYSGMVVLNCILEQAALLSKQGDLETKEVIEYPLRVSLYENSLSDLWISKHLLKIGVTLFGKKIYRQIVQKFKPVLPTRSDQHDFIMPPVQNPTSASFAMGSPSCMTKALARCKSEHVTFAGALTSAVVAAFYHTATSQPDFDPEKPFKLMVDMDYNMRQRVPHPAEEDHVGAFIAFADLGWLLEEGVDMKTTSFWDLARRAKEEIDSNLHHKRMMAAVAMTVDQITNAKMDPSFANELRIENSVDSDGNISNVGRYPFTREFSLGEQDKPFRVKSLHVYNPLPHLGPSAIFYVSSVESFCYSMGHKCEDATASTLFDTWVKICESIGEIGASTTVVEMLRNVASS